MRSISLLVPALVGVCVLAVRPVPAEACDDDDEDDRHETLAGLEDLDIDIDLDDDDDDDDDEDDDDDDDEDDDDDDLDAFAPDFEAQLQRRLAAHMMKLQHTLGRVRVGVPALPPLPPAPAGPPRPSRHGDPQSGYWIDFDIDFDIDLE